MLKIRSWIFLVLALAALVLGVNIHYFKDVEELCKKHEATATQHFRDQQLDFDAVSVSFLNGVCQFIAHKDGKPAGLWRSDMPSANALAIPAAFLWISGGLAALQLLLWLQHWRYRKTKILSPAL